MPPTKHDIRVLRRTLRDFGASFTLAPPLWDAYKPEARLRWKTVRFTPTNAARIPTSNGVYSFVVEPRVANHPKCHYLMYIGKTERQGLRTRYKQYVQDAATDANTRPLVQEMLLQWPNNLLFCYAEVRGARAITRAEETLITAFVPPANQTFPGLLGPARKMF